MVKSSSRNHALNPSPNEVQELYAGVRGVLNTVAANGVPVGNCQYGVYLFRDYDGEPIYVGQTVAKLRDRIGRHLTNQRTDAVAMHVLDPFEVDVIEVWPFWDLHFDYHQQPNQIAKRAFSKNAKPTLDRAEFTVYSQALRRSRFNAILNEKVVKPVQEIDLPESVKGAILPPELREERNHPDVRLARRARTIANLAAIISERQVETGIRSTLLAQAMRLQHLARFRLRSLSTPRGRNGDGAHGETLENTKSTLVQYSEALLALATAATPGEASESNQKLTDLVVALQTSGKEIADLVHELLTGNDVFDS